MNLHYEIITFIIFTSFLENKNKSPHDYEISVYGTRTFASRAGLKTFIKSPTVALSKWFRMLDV